MSSTDQQTQTNNGYPPFAYSLFDRPDAYSFAYKLLNRDGGRIPLVMVHGLSAVGLVDWNPLASELAKHRPVLIFDNRGIGGSTIPKDKLNDQYDVKDMANDVVELVKHLGFREIDLLGFSMGGMIAQQVLVTPRLPFKVRHAVLCATSAKPAHSDLLQAIPQGNPQTLEEKIALVTPFVYIGYDPEFVKDPKNAPLLKQRVLESVHTRRPSRVVAQQVKVIAGYDVRKQLPTAVPDSLKTLLIHGTLDRSVYFTESAYILKGIKHAQLLEYPGMGHAWYDYFTCEYWATLFNDFLNDKKVEAPSAARKAKL